MQRSHTKLILPGLLALSLLLSLLALFFGSEVFLRLVLSDASRFVAKADRMVLLSAFFAFGGLLLLRIGGRFRYFWMFLLGFFLVIAGSGPYGQDLISHLFKVGEVKRGLIRGEFNLYVSWNIAAGRGLPVFVYYSSWLYFPAAFLGLMGLNLFWGMKVTLLALFGLLGVGLYRFLRLFGHRQAALTGTFLFLSSNYILGIFLDRLALAEAAALAIFSYAARYLLKATSRPRSLLVFLSSGLLALTLIIHPLTFINFVPAFFLLLLAGLGEGNGAIRVQRRFLVLGGIGFSALLLSMFRWFPILLERGYVYLHHHGVVHFYPEYLGLAEYVNPLIFWSPGIMQIVIFPALFFRGLRKCLRGEGELSLIHI